jgi:translation initiation factor 3 subunit F
VALDVEYHQTMLDLHAQANPKEIIVGWYGKDANLLFVSKLLCASIRL